MTHLPQRIGDLPDRGVARRGLEPRRSCPPHEFRGIQQHGQLRGARTFGRRRGLAVVREERGEGNFERSCRDELPFLGPGRGAKGVSSAATSAVVLRATMTRRYGTYMAGNGPGSRSSSISRFVTARRERRARRLAPGPDGAPPAIWTARRGAGCNRRSPRRASTPGNRTASSARGHERAIQAWQQANSHAATGEADEWAGRAVVRARRRLPGSAAHGCGRGPPRLDCVLPVGPWRLCICHRRGTSQGREAARQLGARGMRVVRKAAAVATRRAGSANQCGALAIGDQNGYGTGAGETNAKAESSALSNCRAANRNCRVEVSRCVDSDYRRREPVAARLSGPKCTELPGQYLRESHAECWEEFENQRGCHWWTRHYHSDTTARWSGRCEGGLAAGRGTLSISAGSEHPSYEGTGTFVGGKGDGRWTETWADGARFEGELRGGERNGRGTMHWADGGRYEGDYRGGKLHGRGTMTWPDGERFEGDYRDDKRHGHGTYTWADGSRYVGEWHEGNRHGRGTYTSTDGEAMTCQYRIGEVVDGTCTSH